MPHYMDNRIIHQQTSIREGKEGISIRGMVVHWDIL